MEVDETYIGGEEPGLAGGRAQGKKVLTGIAVEVREPKGIGRCRMALLEDGSAGSLLPFVSDHVAPAATVITDAWMGYHGLAKLGYAHRRRSQRAARACGEDPATLLPAVHRVASLAKQWLLSTHQGAVEPAHLQSYLDEFMFRFNRRRSRSRGMVFYRVLELAAGHEPVRYRNITAGNKPRKTSPVPSSHRWGNGPGDTYGWHEHGYERCCIACAAGSCSTPLAATSSSARRQDDPPAAHRARGHGRRGGRALHRSAPPARLEPG